MSFKYILKRPQNKAHKTLEYTLLLPEINTNRLKSSDSYFLVDKILMYTYRNCYCNLLGDFNFLRFFGEQNSPVISKMQETANSSYALNQVKQLDFFGSSILNQCIMSSYDICVKMLTDQQELTTYSFCKLEYKGFNQSLIENALTIPFKIIRTNKSLETEKTSIYHQQINGSNSTKQKDIKSVLASYATSLSKKIIIRKTALEQAGFNFGQPACSKMDYNFADILYKFTQIHENTFSKFMSMYTNEWSISNLTLKQHWDILENIHDLFYNDNIFTTKLSFPKTKIYTDEIYCRYKFERIFCFHSAIKLFQSIEHLKTQKDFPYIVIMR